MFPQVGCTPFLGGAGVLGLLGQGGFCGVGAIPYIGFELVEVTVESPWYVIPGSVSGHATFRSMPTLGVAITSNTGVPTRCVGWCAAEPAKAYYATGEMVTLTAHAHPGLMFVQWVGKGIRAWRVGEDPNQPNSGAALPSDTASSLEPTHVGRQTRIRIRMDDTRQLEAVFTWDEPGEWYPAPEEYGYSPWHSDSCGREFRVDGDGSLGNSYTFYFDDRQFSYCRGPEYLNKVYICYCAHWPGLWHTVMHLNADVPAHDWPPGGVWNWGETYFNCLKMAEEPWSPLCFEADRALHEEVGPHFVIDFESPGTCPW